MQNQLTLNESQPVMQRAATQLVGAIKNRSTDGQTSPYKN